MMRRLDFIPIIPSKVWTKVLIVAWMVILAAPSFAQLKMFFTPASHWFQVTTVHVDDAWEGECPRITTDRVIRRPFVGRYIATIRELAGDGWEMVVPPVATNTIYYQPNSRLPNNATLQWWMEWQGGCHLISGTYVLDTVWQVEPDHMAYKTIAVRSNVFTILRRPVKAPVVPPYEPLLIERRHAPPG